MVRGSTDAGHLCARDGVGGGRTVLEGLGAPRPTVNQGNSSTASGARDAASTDLIWGAHFRGFLQEPMQPLSFLLSLGFFPACAAGERYAGDVIGTCRLSASRHG